MSGKGLTDMGSKALLAASAACFVLKFVGFGHGTVRSFVLAVPAWVVLPTIAGLDQTR